MNPEDPRNTQPYQAPEAHDAPTAQEYLAKQQHDSPEGGDKKRLLVIIAGAIAGLIVLGAAGYFIWHAISSGSDQPPIPDASLITDNTEEVEADIQSLEDELRELDDNELSDDILSDDTIDR